MPRDNATGADNQQERSVEVLVGHGFSRDVTAAILRALAPEVGVLKVETEILRDCMPDSNESLLEKIQSELHGDMQRVAEMSTPPRLEKSLSG